MRYWLMLAMLVIGSGAMIGCDHDVHEARLDKHDLQPAPTQSVETVAQAVVS